MHVAIQLAAFWALAFLTLGMAVVLLNIFFDLIGNDLELHSAGTEVSIAGIASLVEAVSMWLVITLVPAAARAMIVPAIIVALIYKLAHPVDWGRFHVFMLLVFQAVIGWVGVSLIVGHFHTAIAIVVGFAVALFILASFLKDL